MGFAISLAILMLVYALFIIFMDKFTDKKLVTFILIMITFCLYIANVIVIYRDVGIDDWNFKNVLPTANVSPFMFSTIFLCYLLPKKIGVYWKRLISLLSFGMLAAVIYGFVSKIVIDYPLFIQFVLDGASHIFLSMLGIYFLKSRQVDLKLKDCLISALFIVAVATLMLIVNIIWDTSFFGLTFNENYNIYNMVIASNGYISALIYFVGLVLVLTIGYFYLKLVSNIKVTFRKKSSK